MIRLIVLVALLFVLSPCGVDAVDPGVGPVRPNILFILTDDQGWSSLSCYGNTLVPTPHLDQLASEGVRFTDAYVMPQCTPTRAALLTGQHTARTGMWHVIANPWYGYPWAPIQEPPFREGLPAEWPNLAGGLRAAGYATGMAGKWHLTANADGQYASLNPAAGDKYGFDWVAPRGPGSQNEGDKWVDHLTDESIRFIERNRDRPWFVYLAHHTLHGVVSAPQTLVQKHLRAGAPAEGLNNATYLAAIEHLDRSVGRLMKSLDDLGLRQSTIVVFLSDNGGVSQAYDPNPRIETPDSGPQLAVQKQEFSNAPLRGPKGSAYEGGIRVPCIVRWPGVAEAARVDSTPIHIVDWLPTLFEAAGVQRSPMLSADKVPQQRDGLSLVPLLRGEELPERTLFWFLPLYDLRWGATPCGVVRRGDWKLIEHFGDRFDEHGRYVAGRHVELFNLKDDVGETRNLAEREQQRATALLRELHRLIADSQQSLPGSNPHHDPNQAFHETRTKPDFIP